MVKLTIIPDVYDTAKNEAASVENVVDYLMQRFPTWHQGIRIYDCDFDRVALQFDVTPNNEEEIDRLLKLKGPLTVIEYPGTGVEIAIAIVAILAVIAGTFLLMPKQPNTNIKQPTQSPNNSLTLGDRSNQARLGGRINDIFGTVYCIFDMLTYPRRFFVNHVEYEECYTCVGRGSYTFTNNQVYDGDTPVGSISGSSIEVYGPNTSPNSGDAPQFRIGNPIGRKVSIVKRSNSVDGFELFPPNYKYWSFASGGFFHYEGVGFAPYFSQTSGDPLPRYFDAGDSVMVTSQTYTDSGHSANLTGGPYNVSFVGINLVMPGAQTVNTDWNNVALFTGHETSSDKPIVVDGTQGQHGARGPFIMQMTGLTQLQFNFVAPQGLYKIKTSDGSYTGVDVDLKITIQPCDALGNAIGAAVVRTITFLGSSSNTGQLAKTVTLNMTTTTGYVAVSVERLTARDFSSSYTSNDAVIWRDLYAINSATPAHFGNVTTVQSLTRATATASAVKERKLNAEVCRNIPLRTTGTSFTPDLHPTNSADEIFAAVALDPYIGNRTVAELDLDNIYDTVAAVASYFGLDACKEFCYTFDDPDQTFQQTLAVIADAIFCTGYRQGNLFKLSFECLTADSKQLFSHRNKVPKSEQRTYSFGRQNNYDSVALTYVDKDNKDAQATIYVPTTGGINPNQVSTTGVRDKVQGYMKANRIYNKQKYQRIATQFNGLEQADLLVMQDRILVSDNTRPDVRDGDVIDQSGLILTLSQNVTISVGDVIFLQHYDETVESIGIASQPAANQVTLTQAPRLTLSLDPNNWSRTPYEIVSAAKGSPRPFLVSGKSPQGKGVSQVTAINYDDRYYANDADYINGVVDDSAYVTPPGEELSKYVFFGV